MISESLGGYSANLIDGLCSTIAQVLQALRGTSPTPVITPLSDQANKGSTAEKLGTAKNRLQKARAAFTETERKSRGVLSNRYNVDFIPL